MGIICKVELEGNEQHGVYKDSVDETAFIDRFPNLQFAAYLYQSGSYEGSGEALIYDGEWWQVGLGHCSCYSAEDNIRGANNNNKIKDPRDILRKATTQLYSLKRRGS